MDTGKHEMGNESPMLHDEYLWDGSGAPEPEIQRLEGLLGKFRQSRPAPESPALGAIASEAEAGSQDKSFIAGLQRSAQKARFLAACAAAAAVLAFAAVTFLAHGGRAGQSAAPGWNVSSVSGTPRIAAKIIGGKDGTSRLSVGELLETDPQSRANLLANEVGQIEVGPSTRLRLLAMGAGLQRIALERGIIHADIWARPGQFVVDTPSAVTVDLGCAYTLQVDDSGAGLVRTSLGWVGFKLNGREAFIPAGAACATRPKVGPGTPYFENASAEFRAALSRFDFEDSTAEQRAEDLGVVMGAARKRDALTLWHLLVRVDDGQRELVYERLRELAPPPSGVTKEGILRLDKTMLDLWWNALGFDDIAVWRRWERRWASRESQP